MNKTHSRCFVRPLLYALALAGVVAYSSLTFAQNSISINFSAGSFNTMATGSTFGAVPVDGQYWTITTAATGTAANLNSTAGATSATLVWNSKNTYRNNLDFNNTNNNALFKAYLDDGDANNLARFTVSNIPYDFYDVYLYSSTDTAKQYHANFINGIQYSGSTGATAPGTAVWGTSTNQGTGVVITPTEATNYLKVSGQVLSTLTVFSGGGNTEPARGSIAGVQIVDATPADFNIHTIPFAAATGTITATDENSYNGININNTSGGNLALTLNGTLSLTPNNTMSVIKAEAGSAEIAISGGTINFAENSLLKTNGNTFNISSGLSGNGILNTSGDIILNNNYSGFTGTYAIGDGSVTFNTTQNSSTITNTIGGSGTLKLKASDESLKGHFGFRGATLSGFTGTVDITGARMYIDSQDDLGSTAGVTVNVNSTGQLYVVGNATSGKNVINIAGNGWNEIAGRLGALRIESGGNLGGTVNVLSEGARICTYSSDGTLSAALTGSGTLTKTGSKTLTYSGNYANYTGKLYVSEGTLNFQSSNNSDAVYNNIFIDGGTFAFSSARYRMQFQAEFTNKGGTLNLGASELKLNNHLKDGSNTSYIKVGDNVTAASNVTGDFNLNGGTLTLSAGKDSVLNVSAQLWNSGSITKDGAGTVKFTGVNSYTTQTTINAGTLLVEGAGALGTGAITNNGLLQFNNITTTDGLTLEQAITGSGAITKSGTGIVKLTKGSAGPSGVTTITGGELQLAWQNAKTPGFVINGGTLNSSISSNFYLDGNNANPYMNVTEEGVTSYFTGKLNLHNSRIWTFDIAKDSTLNVSAVLSNRGGVTKTGEGTMVFSANNTYEGLTLVEEGTLVVNGNLPGAITINPGAILSGSGQIGQEVNINIGGYLSPKDSAANSIAFNSGLNNQGIWDEEILSAALYDTILVTGDAVFTNTSVLNILTANDYVPAPGDIFNIMTATDGTISGFDNWELLLAPSDRSLWDLNLINGGTVLQLSVASNPAVPEPSAWALLLLGAMGLMYFRRKR